MRVAAAARSAVSRGLTEALTKLGHFPARFNFLSSFISSSSHPASRTPAFRTHKPLSDYFGPVPVCLTKRMQFAFQQEFSRALVSSSVFSLPPSPSSYLFITSSLFSGRMAEGNVGQIDSAQISMQAPDCRLWLERSHDSGGTFLYSCSIFCKYCRRLNCIEISASTHHPLDHTPLCENV